MRGHDERELRARFEQLNAADRASVPEFGAVVEATRTRREASPRLAGAPRLWLVAASVLVVAGGVALTIGRARESAVPSAQPPGLGATISTWTSPTAGLLNASTGASLGSPTVLSSILDGAASAAGPQRGVAR